jgi:hypothetical protein
MPAVKFGKCQLVAQATIAGVQDVRVVRAFGRVDGWTTPYISVRIGQILLNIEDRAALTALIEATQAAAAHSDIAFGSVRRPAA